MRLVMIIVAVTATSCRDKYEDCTPDVHCYVGEDGKPHCDAGYDWDDPDDNDSFVCVRPDLRSCCECLTNTLDYQGDDLCVPVSATTCMESNFQAQCFCWQRCRSYCGSLFPQNC